MTPMYKSWCIQLQELGRSEGLAGKNGVSKHIKPLIVPEMQLI